ncbi:MAG TPA: hypothetical protein VGN22_06985, partial [Pseudonocardia sp.]
MPCEEEEDGPSAPEEAFAPDSLRAAAGDGLRASPCGAACSVLGLGGASGRACRSAGGLPPPGPLGAADPLRAGPGGRG